MSLQAASSATSSGRRRTRAGRGSRRSRPRRGTPSTRSGFAGNMSLPARRRGLGLKYYKEFSNRSTFQGYSLQISGSVTF